MAKQIYYEDIEVGSEVTALKKICLLYTSDAADE